MSDLDKLIEWAITRTHSAGCRICRERGETRLPLPERKVLRTAQRKAHQLLSEEYQRGYNDGAYDNNPEFKQMIDRAKSENTKQESTE